MFLNCSRITLCFVLSISATTPVASIMTSQLLLLYYLLLYEDVRLSNSHQLLSCARRIHIYSPHLFAQLPIRYLLSHAQKEQRLYAGMLMKRQ